MEADWVNDWRRLIERLKETDGNDGRRLSKWLKETEWRMEGDYGKGGSRLSERSNEIEWIMKEYLLNEEEGWNGNEGRVQEEKR
jgi:hypothetical protein